MFNVHIQSKLFVAHDCHGHRYQPSPVPLSGTGGKKGEVSKRRPPVLAVTRVYEQSRLESVAGGGGGGGTTRRPD